MSATMEQLLSSDYRGRFELVSGQLIEVTSSNLTAVIGAELTTILVEFCRKSHLGYVLGASKISARTTRFPVKTSCLGLNVW